MKMIRKIIILALVFFIAHSAIAQRSYEHCILVFNDGSMLRGKAKIPYLNEQKIVFKDDQGNKNKDYNDQLNRIYFLFEDEVMVFDRLLTFKNSEKKTLNKKHYWLNRLDAGYVSLYYGYFRNKYSSNPDMIYWYCKKPHEIAYTMIGKKYANAISIGHHSTFRKKASRYFNDIAIISKQIEDDYYNLNDISVLIQNYNYWAKAMIYLQYPTEDFFVKKKKYKLNVKLNHKKLNIYNFDQKHP